MEVGLVIPKHHPWLCGLHYRLLNIKGAKGPVNIRGMKFQCHITLSIEASSQIVIIHHLVIIPILSRHFPNPTLCNKRCQYFLLWPGKISQDKNCRRNGNSSGPADKPRPLDSTTGIRAGRGIGTVQYLGTDTHSPRCHNSVYIISRLDTGSHIPEIHQHERRFHIPLALTLLSIQP